MTRKPQSSYWKMQVECVKQAINLAAEAKGGKHQQDIDYTIVPNVQDNTETLMMYRLNYGYWPVAGITDKRCD
jgi:hypothetical protein